MLRTTFSTLAAGLVAAVIATPAVAHEAHETGAEPDIEIVMGDMYFKEAGDERGQPIHMEAGELNLLRVVNEGNIEHELHIGRNAKPESGLYQENLFGPKLSGEHSAHGFLGVVLEPGESADLHVWIPENRTGEWEAGCFIPGHYSGGMRAPVSVE